MADSMKGSDQNTWISCARGPVFCLVVYQAEPGGAVSPGLTIKNAEN